jgi:hypothetical protein
VYVCVYVCVCVCVWCVRESVCTDVHVCARLRLYVCVHDYTGMRSGEDESGLASKNVAVLTSAKETKTSVRITAVGRRWDEQDVSD